MTPQHLALQVDVVPAQSEDLALTHPEIPGPCPRPPRARYREKRRGSLGLPRGAPRLPSSRTPRGARPGLRRCEPPCPIAERQLGPRGSTARAWLTRRRQATGDRLPHGDVPPAAGCSCASLTLPRRGINWYLMRLRYRCMVVGRMLVCPSIQVARKSPTVWAVGGRCHPRERARGWPRSSSRPRRRGSCHTRLRRTWRPLASKPTVTRASHWPGLGVALGSSLRLALGACSSPLPPKRSESVGVL